jgi:HK97 family phage prohead protease
MLAPLEVKADAPEGSVRAAFSIFNTIDSSSDVVLPTAFEDGREVLLSPAHDWGAPPIGKGVVRVRPDHAEFDGAFFLSTAGGREWYESVKAAGALQQWSFGYEILDAERGEFQGKAVQFLKKLKVLEVSPVLVGDNQRTHTVAVKGDAGAADAEGGTKAAARGSYEQRTERLRAALAERYGDGRYSYFGYIVATYADRVIACLASDDMADYWSIPYTLDADGMPALGEPERVEATFVAPAARAVAYAAHGDQALAGLKEWAARTRALAALRAKEGRVLSEANRTRLGTLAEAMRTVLADVDDLLATTERRPAAADADADADSKALAAAMRRSLQAGADARRLLIGVRA